MPAIPLMAPPTPPGHFETPWQTGQNGSNHSITLEISKIQNTLRPRVTRAAEDFRLDGDNHLQNRKMMEDAISFNFISPKFLRIRSRTGLALAARRFHMSLLVVLSLGCC